MRRPVQVLLLLQFLGGAILVAQRTFFPVYSNEIGMSAVLISFVSGSRQILGMLAAITGGYLADVIGRKWTYFAGNAAFLIAAVLFFTGSHVAVAALWIASGFLFGLRALGGQSYLVDAADPERLGTASALFTWGTTIGGATGTLVLGFVLERSGYPTFAATILAFTCVVLAINAIAMPRLKRPAGHTERQHTRYRELVRDPAIIKLTALRFIPTFYWGMAIVLVPLILIKLGGTAITVAAYGTVSQVFASLCQLATGRFTDRIGPRKPAIVVLSTLAVAVIATGIFAGNLVMVFVLSTVAAAAAWSMSALIPVLIAHSMNTEYRARALGWVHLWWNVGMVAGSWVGGALFEIRPGIPFAVAGGLLLSTPLVAARLLARRSHA